jgi:hypothetical protein
LEVNGGVLKLEFAFAREGCAVDVEWAIPADEGAEIVYLQIRPVTGADGARRIRTADLLGAMTKLWPGIWR